MRLLVTRPEPDATRTAEALRARGHDVLVAPLLRDETIAAELGRTLCGVLMTSANAARALAAHPRRGELTRLPVFTVGARTAEAARAAGFANISVGRRRAAAIWSAWSPRKVDRSARGSSISRARTAPAIWPAISAERGITVETAVIYRAVAAETLPPQSRRRRLREDSSTPRCITRGAAP